MSDITLTAAREAATNAARAMVEADRQMSEAIKTVIFPTIKPLFDEFPFLAEVAWTQYTPYFNDGEPCVFSCAIDDPVFASVVDVENGEHAHGYENSKDFASKLEPETYTYDYSIYRQSPGYESSPNPSYDPECERCRETFCELVRAFRTDDSRPRGYDEPSTFDRAMLAAFGDHAMVRVTRDGIEVDEYEHE